MTPLEIMFVVAVVAIFIVQYLHFSYRLNKERVRSTSYANDTKTVRENYCNKLKEKDEEIEEKRKTIEKCRITERTLENDITSWKDSSNQKEVLLVKLNIKLNIYINLLRYLKNNWNKSLSVIENGEEVTWPALRLSIKDEAKGYSVNTYQGSRDVSNKTDFFFQIKNDVCMDLESIIFEVNNTHNPIDSEKIQAIINYLNQTNE